MDNNIINSPRWSAGQKLAFRFLGFYFFIYALPFSFQPATIWDPLVRLASKMTGMPYEVIEMTGSGDTSYAYLQHFALVCITLVVGIVWSVLDRRRANYNKMLFWLMIFMRYFLAIVLIGYGSAKLFKSQFPSPYLYRLVEPFGHASPMGLAWTFLGYSYGYNLFMGIAETLGGILLLFRRTTVFGALFSITVLLNVFMMNMFYDIPVKLFSFHLLCLAIFIALPDVKRLFTFFFTDKTVYPPTRPAFVFTRGFTKWKNIIKMIFIVLMGVWTVWQGIREMKEYGDDAPKGPLYGIYYVQYFVRNSDTLAPLITDSNRWQRLIIENEFARVTMMNDSSDKYEVKVDTAKKELSLIALEGGNAGHMLYENPDKQTLLLSGILNKDTVSISFKRKGPEDFLLMNRGFHWISEYPFNR
jgi:hypothetical protein